MTTESKAREFIAYKRTKSSSWLYYEFSEETDQAIDSIAPDAGNFCKLRLIEKSAYDELADREEKMVKHAAGLREKLNQLQAELAKKDELLAEARISLESLVHGIMDLGGTSAQQFSAKKKLFDKMSDSILTLQKLREGKP